MRDFKNFMEDGAGAMGSGAAGLQSGGGSPSIPTSTRGVAGTGDDSSTVPVSKKRQQQYTGTKFNRSEYKRTVPTVGLQTRANRVKEVKEETKEKSPRKITGAINVGTQTAPAQTFMTKEEHEKPFKVGHTVYIKNENPKLQNTPTSGKIYHVGKDHVKLRTVGGTGLYRAKLDNISHNSKDSWLHMKYHKEETVKSQNEIVKANAKTEGNPTGFVPKKKFSEIRIKTKD